MWKDLATLLRPLLLVSAAHPTILNCLTNINMSKPILLTFTQIYEAQSVRQLPLSFLATTSEAIPLIYFVHNVNKYTWSHITMCNMLYIQPSHLNNITIC